jgi:hypothetical protein
MKSVKNKQQDLSAVDMYSNSTTAAKVLLCHLLKGLHHDFWTQNIFIFNVQN